MLRAKALLRSLAVVACVTAGACAGVNGPVSENPDESEPGDPRDLRTADDLADPGGADLAGDMAVGTAGCDPTSKTLGAAGGPDVCAYGERCDATSKKCVAVATDTCAMVGGAPAWNKSAKIAPVVTAISASLVSPTNSTTECLNGDPAALVTVEFYAPSFFTTKNDAGALVQQVKYRKSTTSTDQFFSATFARALPMPSQRFGSFTVGINCGGAGGAVKQAGVYIVDEGGRVSNPVCVSW